MFWDENQCWGLFFCKILFFHPLKHKLLDQFETSVKAPAHIPQGSKLNIKRTNLLSIYAPK